MKPIAMPPLLLLLAGLVGLAAGQEIGSPLVLIAKGAGAPSFSGIRPHLAAFNGGGECGIGALVAWADKLWWVTYAPHKPRGFDDRLHVMNAAGDHLYSRASIGGTPANRMVHEESGQLFLGPYVIGEMGTVGVIPWSVMGGRLTAAARHLGSSEKKIYVATMEEGLYEVDIQSLEVTHALRGHP